MSLYWVDGIAKVEIELLISCFELHSWEKQLELPNRRAGKRRETFAPWWQRLLWAPWSWRVADDRFSITVWPACGEWMLTEHGKQGTVISARGTSRLALEYARDGEHLFITDKHRRAVERLLCA